ncbi:hypothetical protein VTO42DRAFT_8674 [Malbranchea cinnamomea]
MAEAPTASTVSPPNDGPVEQAAEPAAPENDEDLDQPKCAFCFDSIDRTDARIRKPCIECRKYVCGDCIRRMFTTASKDPLCMPPRCCSIPFNLAVAMPFLTDEEIDKFKAKYEEWLTPNPVYCPVPTCSAFIPFRLFPKNKQPRIQASRRSRGVELDVEEVMAFFINTIGELTTTSFVWPNVLQPVLPAYQSVPCPQCATLICCDCKLLAHPGSTCSSSNIDIDAGLAAFLRGKKIKRCPKCHAGTRKMYGCRHIVCRCGCHWCFQCERYFEVCTQKDCYRGNDYLDDDDSDEPEDDDVEDDPGVEVEGQQRNTDQGSVHNPGDADGQNEGNASSETQSPPAERQQRLRRGQRDLDAGGYDRWHNEQYNFGVEGDRNITNPWVCDHEWEQQADCDSRGSDLNLCEFCWRSVTPLERPYPEAAHLMEFGSLPKGDAQDSHEDGYFACECCHWVLCKGCFAELGFESPS